MLLQIPIANQKQRMYIYYSSRELLTWTLSNYQTTSSLSLCRITFTHGFSRVDHLFPFAWDIFSLHLFALSHAQLMPVFTFIVFLVQMILHGQPRVSPSAQIEDPMRDIRKRLTIVRPRKMQVAGAALNTSGQIRFMGTYRTFFFQLVSGMVVFYSLN